MADQQHEFKEITPEEVRKAFLKQLVPVREAIQAGVDPATIKAALPEGWAVVLQDGVAIGIATITETGEIIEELYPSPEGWTHEPPAAPVEGKTGGDPMQELIDATQRQKALENLPPRERARAVAEEKVRKVLDSPAIQSVRNAKETVLGVMDGIRGQSPGPGIEPGIMAKVAVKTVGFGFKAVGGILSAVGRGIVKPAKPRRNILR